MSRSNRLLAVHRGPATNFFVERLAVERGWTIVAYVDDHASAGEPTNGIPVMPFAAWQREGVAIPTVVTALDPHVRRALVERIVASGGSIAPADAAGWISRDVRFGDGALIDGNPLYVGPTTSIGRHTIVMTPTSIGHDCVIGDFVTIYPSVAISGHVTIEDDVILDVGSVIVNGRSEKPLLIGRGARIDVGSVVTRPVPPGAIVRGNPGRIERRG